MSGLISRQDAIDAIFSEPLYESGMKKRDADAVVPAIYEKIKSLPSAEKAQLSEEGTTFDIPSAEPKTPSNGSITSMNTEKMHDRTMGDLISRQEAKDAIDMALDHIDHVPPWVYDKLLNALNEVPSAEKAQLSEEDATKDATSGLIRRQDAIDAVKFGITYAKAINKSTGEVKELFKEGNKALNEAVERLKELPSAEPERKTGKWKRAYLDREAMGERPSIFYCSVCNQCIAYPVNYCPSCGADMRGGSDG